MFLPHVCCRTEMKLAFRRSFRLLRVLNFTHRQSSPLPNPRFAIVETSAITSNRNSLLRSNVILAAIVAANAAFDIFLPMNQTNRFPRLLAMGVLFSQPLFLGAWAAFGPSSAVKRLPLTFVALGLVTVANAFRSSNLPADYRELLLIEFGIFATSAAVLATIATFLHSRITRNDHSGEVEPNRFSLKYLVGLTTAVAIVLGLARMFVANDSTPPSAGSWYDLLIRFGFPCAVIVLATLPVLSVPLLVLSPRVNHFATTIAILVAWIVSFVGAISIVTFHSTTEPLQDIIIDIAGLQISAAVVGLVSALGVRFAGYRLTRSRPSLQSA
jgi:hypothetical protein